MRSYACIPGWDCAVAWRDNRDTVRTASVLRGRCGCVKSGYYGYVKKAKISEVKNQLSRYLALVRRGEVVRILDRDTPVAEIVPIDRPTRARSVGEEALAAMERKGLIRRGSGSFDREIVEHDPPGKPAGAVRALLDERGER
jgi:antitoxin (DNA-binding transcriptional repressor) of toxin-antitoxin stability system